MPYNSSAQYYNPQQQNCQQKNPKYKIQIKQQTNPQNIMQQEEPPQPPQPQPFDQKPIGQSQKVNEMSEYPPDFNADQLNTDMKPEPLPLGKRLLSKVWKIRKEAFQQLLAEVSQNWLVYQEYFKDTVGFVTDSNPLCQEKALRVLLKFLQASNCSLDQPRLILKALIEKCLVVEKGEIANIAGDIMFWIMDHYPQVLLNQINDNIMNKNPKICASVLAFLEKLVNNYGARKLKMLEEFAKNFTLLSASVRPIAKPQSIALFKQVYKWMGDNVFGFNMHPEVKQEVVKFTKTYVKEPMVIKRGLNEDQKKGKKPITESADDEDNDEPQDVLGPYDSRWVDTVLQQPKWKDKKNLLDEFIKKTKVKNIVPRENTHYITLIKRLLSDNNINLLQCGFKVVKNLCNGLKKQFTHPSKVVLSLIFSKLRDTKAMIVDEAQQTLQSMMNCLLVQDLLEDIKQGLKDKAPNMRFQTLKLIEKLVSRKDKKMLGPFKNLTLQIVDLNQDGASEVRDKVLDVLCKMKAAYGLGFFGDKLKKLQGKKLQTIQNYTDPNEDKIDEQPIQENTNSLKSKQPILQKKSLKSHQPQAQNSQQIFTKDSKNPSIISQPIPKVPTFNPQSDFQSQSQNIRLQAYQNLLNKSPQQIHQQLIEGFKNKVPMTRESSPNILKVILQCVRKSLHSTVGLQHMELLVYHDWKKCKPLLSQFIQTSKLNLMALEFVKNQGILGQVSGQASKRNTPVEKNTQKDMNSNQHMSNSMSSHLSNQHSNALKLFYSSIPSLIPKMSNPDPVVRLNAADTALQLLKSVPIGSPIESVTEPSAATTEAISQLFNVLKFRIQDSNHEISNNYITLITQMLSKGFLTKYRTPGRLIISMLIQKTNNPHLTNLQNFIKEMVTNHAVILWQFLTTELAKESMCSSVLNIIKMNNQSFFKNADQKAYILPLITCISKDLESQKCGELLDQIVEINGEQSLERIVKEHKISSFSLDNYLKKWHIHVNGNNGPHSEKGKLIQGNNFLFGNPSVLHSKLQRLNAELQNPWPLTPSSSHIIKLIGQMLAMAEPFPKLASPTLLTDQQLLIVANLRNQVIEDYSDILTKWVFWRVHIESQPKNLQTIFHLIHRLISIGFELQQSQIVTILGALINCLTLHKAQYLKQIIRINQYLNQHPLYKEKAFRFWINSFNQPTAPVDQILNLFVNSCPDMVPSQLVTLARFPAVVRNKEFNSYLRSNFNQKLLTVYGFKLQDISKNEQKPIISESLNIQILTEVQSKYFIQLFQRLSSADLVQKIAQETETIHPQFVMQIHLKIMHSVIVPYLHKQLSFINVYNYFKYVQKIMLSANNSPFLLNLVRTLSFFLIDLDELKLENSTEMVKTINKLLLILLEISDPKHILEVLFLMMKQQLKINGNIKLCLLLPKCISKVIKNPIFKSQYERSSENTECLSYIVKEFMEILSSFQISPESCFLKTTKHLLNQMLTMFPRSLAIFESFIQNNSENIPESALNLITDLTRDKARQANLQTQKVQSSFASSQNSYVQSKDIKNPGNMMKTLKMVSSQNAFSRKPIQK